jgi:hypothetical protein
VREATHGVDGLVGQIVISGGVVLDQLEQINLNGYSFFKSKDSISLKNKQG